MLTLVVVHIMQIEIDVRIVLDFKDYALETLYPVYLTWFHAHGFMT